MRCVSCGFTNPEGLKFCTECGVALKRRCAQCGCENAPQAKFCGECGQALRAPAPTAVAPPRAPAAEPVSVALPVATPHTHEAERRQLTVMFCDLVGSTALSAQLDPEDYRRVVQHYHQTCDAILQRHAGYVAQPLGDGLLVYFGYPTAHEDDARRAVRAGVEIVEVLKEKDTGNKEQGKQPLLPVRIGVHTGLVVIGEIGTGGRTEHLALGDTPNIAARIQGLAEPNTVIISAATHRLVEGQFECQPLGSHLIKGIATPIAVYHVQSERQYVSPLAGRTTLVHGAPVLTDSLSLSPAYSNTPEAKGTDTARAGAAAGSASRTASDGFRLGRCPLGRPLVGGVSDVATGTDSRWAMPTLRKRAKPKRVFSRPLPLPASSERSRWNSALR